MLRSHDALCLVAGLLALLAGNAPAPAGTLPNAGLLHRATFVHMVGRTWMIEQWVTTDLGATLIEIMPISYLGNPAFRVTYLPRGATKPKIVILMANGAFERGTFEPIEVEPTPTG